MNVESWQKPERNEKYDEHLEEVYGGIQIAGVYISPSDALYHCDPVAYRCGVADYLDEVYAIAAASEWREGNYG